MSIVGHVESCFRYPVKGCNAISGNLEVDPERGVWGDRQFVVVSQSRTSERFLFGKAITQRQFPGLTTVKVEEISCGKFYLSYADGVISRTAYFQEQSAKKRKEKLFAIHKADVPIVGEHIEGEIEYFFENMLGVPVHFYSVPHSHPRKHASKLLEKDLNLGYADSHPILITNTRSLAEVNMVLAGAYQDIVPMSRFRPNIVVSTPLPWEEDTWKVVRIGKAVLEYSAQCGRCQVTTIDQETGHVNKEAEPLRTLSKMRPARGGPLFGSYYAIGGRGTIASGMSVERLA